MSRIETRALTKIYGDLYAVKDLSLKLEPGDVYGFIGPNGSGKTTTMRMIATLLQPTHGEAYVCGYSIYNKPKEMPFPPHWMLYVRVADINQAAEAVKAGGCKVLYGPAEVPGGDRIVNCLDPQGAAFSLHERRTA